MARSWLRQHKNNAGNRQQARRRKPLHRSGRIELGESMAWVFGAAALLSSIAFLAVTRADGYFRPVAPLWATIDKLAAKAGLGLHTISLAGLKATADEEIFAALELENFQTLLAFDAGRARRRLQVLPWIKDVRIKQAFPGRLDITIKERRPYALWISQDGEILVDRDGRRLAAVRAGAVRDLPVIEGRGAPQTARSLFRALASYPELNPVNIRAIRVAGRRWTLILNGRRQLLLPEQHYDKALAVAMRGPRGHRLIDRDFAMLDLRVAGQIALRPQGRQRTSSRHFHKLNRKTQNQRNFRG